MSASANKVDNPAAVPAPASELTTPLTKEQCHKLVELLSANDGAEYWKSDRKVILNMPVIYEMLGIVNRKFRSRFYRPNFLNGNIFKVSGSLELQRLPDGGDLGRSWLQTTEMFKLFCDLVGEGREGKYNVNSVLQISWIQFYRRFFKIQNRCSRRIRAYNF